MSYYRIYVSHESAGTEGPELDFVLPANSEAQALRIAETLYPHAAVSIKGVAI